jgi:glucose/mannose transport system substrate-binding protein
MDVCAQKAHTILENPANQVESMEILSPPNFSGAMQDAVTQYWNNPGMSADAFIEKIVAAMRDAA